MLQHTVHTNSTIRSLQVASTRTQALTRISYT